MAVSRFIPEDPYTPPNIPVDDMNNQFYSYQGNEPQTLPLPWYPEHSGDTKPRYDLRLLPDSELTSLGWTLAPQMPSFNPDTHTIRWDKNLKNWVVLPIPTSPQP